MVADIQERPRLTIDVSQTRVVLHGDVSSVAHESILRERARSLFPQRQKSFELHERPALPPGWALISELTLRATAETYSSTAEITPAEINIRAIITGTQDWHGSLSRVERNLLPGMQLVHQLSEIKSTGSLQRHCISLFRTAMRGRKIEFQRANASLGTEASQLLDELIQIATDCPAGRVRITGHTDNTGEESGNLALSVARAESIAAYMTSRGIEAERLRTHGAGSSRPLVNEDTLRAHQLNRRIDIELEFPEG